MAVDIRATVRCSLGELISASVSDDYIQGSGLIKTRGSCEISGLISPAVGTIVTFTYTKSGVARTLPRKLRVLSSFADPYRRTTKVELGCKLTYLQSLSEPLKWTSRDDPANSDISDAENAIVVFPIRAASVMSQCLAELGLSASSIPLTNRFSIPEFDFSPGYVQVLSDLLVSESYAGYLDINERLQIINLSTPSASGPAFGVDRLIDIGPINVGELAGDSVIVTFSTLRLAIPDDTEIAERNDDEDEPRSLIPGIASGWNTLSSSTVNTRTDVVAYSREDAQGNQIQFSNTYASRDAVTETVRYSDITVSVPGGTETRKVVTSRTLSESRSFASLAGTIISQYLSNGINVGNFSVSATTQETFQYDRFGNEIFRSLTKTGDRVFGAGALSVPYVLPALTAGGQPQVVPIPGGSMKLERVTVDTYHNGTYKRSVTRRFGPWIYSLGGQQTVAEGRIAFTQASEVSNFIDGALSGEYLIDVSISTERTAPGSGAQEAPADAESPTTQLADANGDPNNGFRVEGEADFVLVTGSSGVARRITLSMPYAPDDSFSRTIKTVSPLSYTYRSTRSDARAKAATFGRTQNRLLFGNRNGMNIQVSPELLPAAPFGAFYINANGTATQYRTNGTSWTMDSNGIVASTDALYWGVAGKT